MKISSPNRGVALVIVLGFLVLLSGLAIAFFSSVTSELTASRTYSSGISTRQLTDSAVNLVMGQIREATSKSETAWASQPGMIRVYDTPTGSNPAKAVNFFKLYSARNMVVTESQIANFDPGATPAPYTSDRDGAKGDVPSDWNDFPGLFTDLNSPILVSDPANPSAAANPAFPIVDPRAMETVNGGPLVEGFSFDADVNLAVKSGSSEKWRIPMPARWIYVLRDGTLTSPNKEFSPTGGGTGAEWTGSDFRVPTKENPIVGRIAFWADDDTSKVNINTAGGHAKQSQSGYQDGYSLNSYAGSFWDTPRVFTNFDIGQTDPTNGTLISGVGAGGLAATQPFQKEYQRYPGHPATTSLGAVFARLLTSEQLYKLTPRLNGGGSIGGTVRTERATAVELQLKTERLYASLDELLYSQGTVGSGKRETNDAMLGTSGAITPDKLEKMKFFLTPHSRAPDLNLFGQPRVSIWPVAQANDEATGRNGFDRAIAFCSTIPTYDAAKPNDSKKFIFTRTNGSGALSTTNDITQAQYSRNKELMLYLRELTGGANPSSGRKIPGFGGNFGLKYGVANRDMILGQIFDYIRIANLRDTTTGMTPYQYAKAGVVAPSRADIFNTGRKIGGFGRAATISEVSLVFYCTGVEVLPGTLSIDNQPITENPFQGEVKADQRNKITHRYMRAFVILSTFHPMQGYAPIVAPTVDGEKQVFQMEGLEKLKANGEPLFPSGVHENKVNWVSGSTWAGRNFGGYEGFMHTLASHNTDYKFTSEGTSVQPVKIPVTEQTFEFKGGRIELWVKFGPDNVQQTNVLQKMTLEFPDATWPVPRRRYRLVQGGFVKGDQTATFNNRARIESAQNLLDRTNIPDPYDASRSLPGRITWTLKDSNNPNNDSNNKEFYGIYGSERWRQIIQPGDVVRSLVYGNASNAKSADLRVLALTEIVPVEEFSPHPDYNSDSYRFAQGLRAADGSLYVYNMPFWDIDWHSAEQTPAGEQPRTSEKGTLSETTAYGNHVPFGRSVPASKQMQLPYSQAPNSTTGFNGVNRYDPLVPAGRAGDFDTGVGVFADGPFAGKQDEGNVIFKYFDVPKQEWIYPIPYAGTHSYEPPGDIFFSPNRQMPSPGLFGSLLSQPLPTDPSAPPGSEKAARHWQTLSFAPNTASIISPGHPGNAVTPRDHLLLDLFTMPFVEPYLISEPLSTAGRVNLNYQIAPFGYIKRSTALRAAITPLRVSAIRTTFFNTYKTGASGKPLPDPQANIRLAIDRDETIKAIDSFFSHYKTNRNKGFFKSATEICERYLYPTTGSIADPKFQAPTFDPDPSGSYDPGSKNNGEASMISFWTQRNLTGDNLREKPYTDLYPRVTTKSNTYTVHMRVQTVRQVGTDGDFKKWREGKDVVLSEYRGAATIERYIDPSDSRLKDKLDPVKTPAFEKRSLEDLYRFRVVNTKKFAP